ncbi:hypothetical protein ASG54_03240 [Aureimonas sp. Leaf460]|nr:hypothetical protein ASG62_21280 [Aureimonas sp. Leaf427]KQT78049.1 hypothetical protein ASG54_03240 [Aureimonas sp. Leaf460]
MIVVVLDRRVPSALMTMAVAVRPPSDPSLTELTLVVSSWPSASWSLLDVTTRPSADTVSRALAIREPSALVMSIERVRPPSASMVVTSVVIRSKI